MRPLIVPRRRLQELAPSGDSLFKAKLGEDYDGIGQYVLVTLAGSAIGGAYKSRVAAGDFGGGRTFPRGTPVTVHSYRGQLEVFLGNIPQPCVFLDDFNDRTIDGTKKRNTYTGFVDPLSDEVVAWGLSTNVTQWLVSQFADPTHGGEAGVSGGLAYMLHHNATDGESSARVEAIPFNPGSDDFQMLMPFRLTDDTITANRDLIVELFDADFVVELDWGVGPWSLDAGGSAVAVTESVGELVFLELDWVAATATLQARAWPEGSEIPDWLPGDSFGSAWYLTHSFTNALTIRFSHGISGVNGEYSKVEVDYVKFCPRIEP